MAALPTGRWLRHLSRRMSETVFYHRTTIAGAREIAKNGFADEKWGFDIRDDRSGEPLKMVGVWLTNRPLGEHEGPEGDAVLEVRISLSEESLQAFELEELFWDARIWVVPAELINPHITVRILEVDPRTSWFHEAIDPDEPDEEF